jgi:hypothetical protein
MMEQMNEQELFIEPEEELSVETINARIKEEICYETLNELTDANLMNEYKNCNSVRKEITKLEYILEQNSVDEKSRKKIIDEYLLELIPPGTKGVIRGNKFNAIIKECITNLSLDPERFDIHFEQRCNEHNTDEKPDWYIREINTNKIIIGMNQVDLWRGGAQSNRGSKYLIDNKHNNENSKLLCVVCNEIQFAKKHKALNLFKVGFKNNTLCYLNGLRNIIITFFN